LIKDFKYFIANIFINFDILDRGCSLLNNFIDIIANFTTLMFINYTNYAHFLRIPHIPHHLVPHITHHPNQIPHNIIHLHPLIHTDALVIDFIID